MYCMREERRGGPSVLYERGKEGGPSVLYERGKEGGTQCIV